VFSQKNGCRRYCGRRDQPKGQHDADCAGDCPSTATGGRLLISDAQRAFFNVIRDEADNWELYGSDPTKVGRSSYYDAQVLHEPLRECHFPDAFFDVVTILDAYTIFLIQTGIEGSLPYPEVWGTPNIRCSWSEILLYAAWLVEYWA